MNRSSEVKGGLASRATGRARAPFDRNRVVGAPRHRGSERASSCLPSCAADTAGRQRTGAAGSSGRPSMKMRPPPVRAHALTTPRAVAG